MKKQKHIAFTFIVLTLLTLLSSCTPTALKQNSVLLQSTEIQIDTSIIPDSVNFSEADEDVDNIDTVAVKKLLMDSLIAIADSACKVENFEYADSILQNVLQNVIQTIKQTSEDSSWIDQYFKKIAAMYADLIPSSFLDHIPENIAVLVFQRQLTLSLDSLSLSPEDSTRLADLKCQNGVPYNVPIEWNERVQKAIYLVLKKRGKYLPKLFSRANHYLPFMKKMFADSGLPTDLAYLPLIESGFNPKAYSYAHASGIWQFIPSTARNFKMRSTYWVDERRDPIKSTAAAISYLKKLYEEFGHWYLALAAYNCGEYGLERAISRADTNNYWELKLPKQTMNYVPQYLAMLMVAKNASCFGVDVPQSDVFEYDTVTINDCIDMRKIANGIEVSEKELVKINPHIRRWCTPPDANNVRLYLPAGKLDKYNTFYASLSQKDKVKWFRYRIKSGDNLGAIANKYGVSVSILKSINRLHNNRIIAGRHLFIPVPHDRPYLAKTYHKKNVRKISAYTSREMKSKGLTKKTYKVKKGDTISEIAEKYNVSTKDLYRWNRISHAKRLKIGQNLTLYVKKNGTSIKKQKKSMPVPYKGAIKEYKVKKGDNLYTIAHNLNTPIHDLALINGKNENNITIYPGEILKYPVHPKTVISPKEKTCKCDSKMDYIIRTGDNLSTIATKYSVPLAKLMSCNCLTEKSVLKVGKKIKIPKVANNTSKTQNNKPSNVVYYKVKNGDNLWTIAKNFETSVSKLCEVNNLSKKSFLVPGDSLIIKKL